VLQACHFPGEAHLELCTRIALRAGASSEDGKDEASSKSSTTQPAAAQATSGAELAEKENVDGVAAAAAAAAPPTSGVEDAAERFSTSSPATEVRNTANTENSSNSSDTPDASQPSTSDAGSEQATAALLTQEAEEELLYLKSLPREVAAECEADPQALQAAVSGDARQAEAKISEAFKYVKNRVEIGSLQSGLERALVAAEKDQFARLGVTAGDLRTYLEVAVDLEDAAFRPERPRISPERSRVYRRVADVLEKGHPRSEGEQAWLQDLVNEEVVNLPWPTPLVREWLKRRGIKPGPFRKKEATMYDQV
jgi:hypothetical protein